MLIFYVRQRQGAVLLAHSILLFDDLSYAKSLSVVCVDRLHAAWAGGQASRGWSGQGA